MAQLHAYSGHWLAASPFSAFHGPLGVLRHCPSSPCLRAFLVAWSFFLLSTLPVTPLLNLRLPPAHEVFSPLGLSEFDVCLRVSSVHCCFSSCPFILVAPMGSFVFGPAVFFKASRFLAASPDPALRFAPLLAAPLRLIRFCPPFCTVCGCLSSGVSPSPPLALSAFACATSVYIGFTLFR